MAACMKPKNRDEARTGFRESVKNFWFFPRMPLHVIARLAVVVICFLTLPVDALNGAGFIDPGFENYVLSSGDFLKPATGPWLFGVNTDAGVVEPYSPNSSTGPLDTWSATFAPHEGQQYASTYAGNDTIRQEVSFGAAGVYMISAYAAAPNGSVTIPSVGTLLLEDGEFAFTLDNVGIGSSHVVPKGSSWNSYSAVFNIDSPGNYKLGIRTSKSAPYFINFDSFAIQSVPEPSVFVLFGMGLLGLTAFFLRTRK
jgi:hypothetical protein